MQKSIVSIIAVIACLLTLNSCQESADKRKNDLIKKYQKVLSLKDYSSASFYLQEYLFMDSTKVEYMDSLARHFVMLNNIEAAEAMAKKVVESQPLNEDMQTLLAQIDFQNRDFLTGMARFDKLFAATKDFKFIFKKGWIYAQAGQANKTLEVVDQLLAVPDNAIKTIEVNKVSDPSAKQQVKIKAAALFLKSIAYLGSQNPDSKKAYPFLKESLEIQNDFELAIVTAQKYYPQSK